MNLTSYYSSLKCLLIPLLFIASMSNVFSQQMITGAVVDSLTGEPLVGATVLVVGTTTGTFTDDEGKFSLNLPENAGELRFSYVGFRTQILPIGSTSSFSITLTPDSWLDEVMVIGYGTIKKEDATGSVQSVNTKDFNRGAINSPTGTTCRKDFRCADYQWKCARRWRGDQDQRGIFAECSK